MFHFIHFFRSEKGGYFDKYNSKYIRTFMTFVQSNFSEENLDKFAHWNR